MIISIPATLQSDAVKTVRPVTQTGAKRKNRIIERMIADKIILSRESYRHAFMARVMPGLWAYAAVGPLGAIFIRNYQVVIDDNTLILVRLNILGKIDHVDRIPFSEIAMLDWKGGLLTNRIKLKLKNGRKMRLDSNRRAAVAMDDVLSTDEALEFVKSRIV